MVLSHNGQTVVWLSFMIGIYPAHTSARGELRACQLSDDIIIRSSQSSSYSHCPLCQGLSFLWGGVGKMKDPGSEVGPNSWWSQCSCKATGKRSIALEKLPLFIVL